MEFFMFIFIEQNTELSLKQPPQSDYNMQLSGNISSTFRSSFLVIANQTTRVIALLRKTYSGSDLDNSEQFYWKGDYSDLTVYIL